MQDIRTILGKDCDIPLPPEYRKALDLRPGDEVVLSIEDRGLRILPSKQAVKFAQELVRRYIPASAKLVDSLIRDRRAEAEHE